MPGPKSFRTVLRRFRQVFVKPEPKNVNQEDNIKNEQWKNEIINEAKKYPILDYNKWKDVLENIEGVAMLYYDKQLFKLVDKFQMRNAIREEIEVRLPEINKKLNFEEKLTLVELAQYTLNRFSPLESPDKI